MKSDKTVWYRQLSSPGVEFHFRLAKGAPKRYEVVIRSAADNKYEVVYEIPDPSVGVTHLLVPAGMEFARQIQEETLNARKRKLDAIAAREAQERAVSEGQERQPEGSGEGKPVQDDALPANNDGRSAEESAQGAG